MILIALTKLHKQLQSLMVGGLNQNCFAGWKLH